VARPDPIQCRVTGGEQAVEIDLIKAARADLGCEAGTYIMMIQHGPD
jgi:hypothetical protein